MRQDGNETLNKGKKWRGESVETVEVSEDWL